MSAGTISPGLAISSARCLRSPVAVGTPAPRHFAVHHFVVHEIFGEEPNEATMQPFIQALAD